MSWPEKVCPLVIRGREVLAFRHPLAGKQFVKGSIALGETPAAAAARELREESGIVLRAPPVFLTRHPIGPGRRIWHLFRCAAPDLPATWRHATEDDHGHVFDFFWHPLDRPPDRDWHPLFHEVFAVFRPLIA